MEEEQGGKKGEEHVYRGGRSGASERFAVFARLFPTNIHILSKHLYLYTIYTYMYKRIYKYYIYIYIYI